MEHLCDEDSVIGKNPIINSVRIIIIYYEERALLTAHFKVMHARPIQIMRTKANLL